MDEKIKADIYLAYLDRILAGEKNIEPVEDVEIAKLLLLAKTMIAADLREMSSSQAIEREFKNFEKSRL